MSIFDGLGRNQRGNGAGSGVTFQDAMRQVNENPEEYIMALDL